MMNMANSGPHTNSAQFCFTLGDRSYLDGNYTVFGEVVEGLDVVMRIAQGHAIERVRIVRVGARAEAFRPATESFRAMVQEAQNRVADHADKKRDAERAWIVRNHPKAAGPTSGVFSEQVTAAAPPASADNGAPGNADPLPFLLEPGKTKISSGLDHAIVSMSPGERRIVIVPAAVAYGRAGSSSHGRTQMHTDRVKPKSVLI